MAKPSQELTNLRAARAKELFSLWNNAHPENKKTQAGLAESMGKSTIVINAKLNGKRSITLDDAKKIADYFPGVRYQYIMGEDDYITMKSQLESVVQTARNEGNLMFTGLSCFASLSGFEITPPKFESGSDIKTILNSLSTGYLIRKDGKELFLSLEEMNKLENHFCDSIASTLQLMFDLRNTEKK